VFGGDVGMLTLPFLSIVSQLGCPIQGLVTLLSNKDDIIIAFDNSGQRHYSFYHECARVGQTQQEQHHCHPHFIEEGDPV
jgi:hypothetical protein